MFEKILVPLDGSELAEVTLPYVEELAGRLNSEVVLLHSCQPEHRQFQHMHEIYINDMAEQVGSRIKKHWTKSTATVRAQTITANEASESICNYVQEKSMGLVVMATHGASGFKTWALGSVVDKVCRSISVPTLLIRANASKSVEKSKLFNRILLTLDGSEASKTAMPFALELATRLKASIVLFQMVRSSYMYAGADGMTPGMGVDYARIDAMEEKRVHGYMAGVASEIREKGIPVTYQVAVGIDAAQGILDVGHKSNTDLVVMASRGNSGITRWVLGSVAEKVLREGDLPLLLVRETKKS